MQSGAAQDIQKSPQPWLIWPVGTHKTSQPLCLSTLHFCLLYSFSAVKLMRLTSCGNNT